MRLKTVQFLSAFIPPLYAVYDKTKKPPLQPTKWKTVHESFSEPAPSQTFDTPGIITFRNPVDDWKKKEDLQDSHDCFRVPEVVTYRAIHESHLARLAGVASVGVFLMGSTLTRSGTASSLAVRISFAISGVFGLGLSVHEVTRLTSYPVLTGKTHPYTPPFPISEETKRNLAIAYKILEITEKVPVNNYPERSIDPNTSTKEEFNDWIARGDRDLYNAIFSQPLQNTQVDGCHNLCTLGLQTLYKQQSAITGAPPLALASPIVMGAVTKEMLKNPPPWLQGKKEGDLIPGIADHTFIIIGEIPQDPPESAKCVTDDETTKGIFPFIREISKTNAIVVCDPWAKSCFPGTEISRFASHWEGAVSIEGKQRTCIASLPPPVFVILDPELEN